MITSFQIQTQLAVSCATIATTRPFKNGFAKLVFKKTYMPIVFVAPVFPSPSELGLRQVPFQQMQGIQI